MTLIVAFEHEFHLDVPSQSHMAFSRTAFRNRGMFPKDLFSALREANITPDTFIPEYGPNQYEVTCKPKPGLRAADEAILLREITRSVAHHHSSTASFSPLVVPGGVGNGLHIHFSLLDSSGKPATYDPTRPYGLAETTGQFAAGVLKYLPSMLALLAPSNISCARLTPHKWSAAFNNLGFRDREAAVRICPFPDVEGIDPAASYNLEIRAADSTASPYLQLASIVFAGCQGIADGLPAPAVTDVDLSELSPSDLAEGQIQRLPQSLENALELLAADDVVNSWFPTSMIDLYITHKLAEIAYVASMSLEEQCAAYSHVY